MAVGAVAAARAPVPPVPPQLAGPAPYSATMLLGSHVVVEAAGTATSGGSRRALVSGSVACGLRLQPCTCFAGDNKRYAQLNMAHGPRVLGKRRTPPHRAAFRRWLSLELSLTKACDTMRPATHGLHDHVGGTTPLLRHTLQRTKSCADKGRCCSSRPPVLDCLTSEVVTREWWALEYSSGGELLESRL